MYTGRRRGERRFFWTMLPNSVKHTFNCSSLFLLQSNPPTHFVCPNSVGRMFSVLDLDISVKAACFHSPLCLRALLIYVILCAMSHRRNWRGPHSASELQAVECFRRTKLKFGITLEVEFVFAYGKISRRELSKSKRIHRVNREETCHLTYTTTSPLCANTKHFITPVELIFLFPDFSFSLYINNKKKHLKYLRRQVGGYWMLPFIF